MWFPFRLAILSLAWNCAIGKSTDSFTASNGQIYAPDGTPYQVRGTSWFGFETEVSVLHGLWQHDMDFYVSKLKEIRVNTLRIPFSAEWILYKRDMYPDNGLVAGAPTCQHRKSIEILDQLFDKLEDAGIHVMLDLHRLHKEYISELWYATDTDLFTAKTFIKTWEWVLDRYGSRPNLFAVDLLNEPHGRATWGSGDRSTDWNTFAQDAIAHLEARYPDATWLYFVEGCAWGINLSGAINFPIKLPPSAHNRLIYSPHVYGRSVTPSIDNSNIGALHDHWDSAFGNLRRRGATVVVGEWGGRDDLDKDWMNHLVDYLIDLNATSTYFWALNPNSADVMGVLLDDWTTLDEDKVAIMHRLWT